MIPYWPEPVWRAGPFTLHAFGIALAAGLLAGYEIVTRRATALGLESRVTGRYYVVAVLAGLLAGHWMALAGDPPQQGWEWLKIWGSQSALGLALGEVGFLAFAWADLRRRGWPPWPHLNALAFAFPFVWALARVGCALAHDHVGRGTGSFLGVRFPGGTRFDLGLLECLAAAALAAAFLIARGVRRDVFLPAVLVAGGAVRIAMAQLR